MKKNKKELDAEQSQGMDAEQGGDTASESGAEQQTEAENETVEDPAELQAQIAELTDRLYRTAADFDNYRKRTQRERGYMHDDGLRDAIEKLLPVIDNFERAMQSAQEPSDAFFVGMQMILKQLMGTLTDMGVLEIPALNEAFDPEKHFAVSHIDDEQFGDNVVIEVLQKGYQYKEKVIRPSMVRVAN